MRLRREKKTLKATDDPSLKASLLRDVESLQEEIREISTTSEVGNYNLIAAGLVEFKDILKEIFKKALKEILKREEPDSFRVEISR